MYPPKGYIDAPSASAPRATLASASTISRAAFLATAPLCIGVT